MPQPNPTDRKAKRIVVIDDDPAVLAALTFAFEVDGYEVDAFPGVNQSLGGDLGGADCLVVDLRLPDTDGLELLEGLRAMKIDTPAILITSNPKPQELARAAALGVTVVEKPLLTDELAIAVRNTIACPIRL
jgi:two-component system C4-dicarboxylate transport response regulator DctD